MNTKSDHYDVIVIGSGFGGSVAALRATEKGYLLARDDGAGSVAQAFDVGEGFFPGSPGAVLFEQEIGDRAAIGSYVRCRGLAPVLTSRILTLPVLRPWRGYVKRRERLVAGCVVHEEAAEPGQYRDGIAVDVHSEKCAFQNRSDHASPAGRTGWVRPVSVSHAIL